VDCSFPSFFPFFFLPSASRTAARNALILDTFSLSPSVFSLSLSLSVSADRACSLFAPRVSLCVRHYRFAFSALSRINLAVTISFLLPAVRAGRLSSSSDLPIMRITRKDGMMGLSSRITRDCNRTRTCELSIVTLAMTDEGIFLAGREDEGNKGNPF